MITRLNLHQITKRYNDYQYKKIISNTNNIPIFISNNKSEFIIHYRKFSNSSINENFLDEDLEQIESLIQLNSAFLSYPNSNTNLSNINLSIQTPSTQKSGPSTGHVLLGKNGQGKTLISSAISHYDDNNKHPYMKKGSIEYNQRWYKSFVSKVSFQSHLDLLTTKSTVYRALTPHGGRLNKSAQYLVVRFGLYPLLHSPIDSISTGEIRKVQLIRALSHKTKLLILDNAFDGLDVVSRNKLKDLVAKTIDGFRVDMLVQDVVGNVRGMDRTQVMLITHRAEEIVDQIGRVSVFRDDKLVTMSRSDRTGAQLLHSALCHETIGKKDAEKWNTIDTDTWNDSSLPSLDEINSVLCSKQHDSTPVIQAHDLKVTRGNATPISNLNWTVQQGQKWLIAGGNGAGKSTLSRLLAYNSTDHGITNGKLTIQNDANIGWVSTELHMSVSQSSKLAKDILVNPRKKTSNQISNEYITTICKWFNISIELLNKPFNQLSQGEQKLILIASTFLNKPQVIILDEPCQGLDCLGRKRVLGVMERVCRSSNVTFIYITHHMEEVMPSIQHVLHLVGGSVGYVGDRDSYDPNQFVE